MSEFTRKVPNEDSFLECLIVILKTKGYEKIANLLSGSKCTISHTDRWSTKDGGTVYGADSTTVDLAVPVSKYPDTDSVTGEENEAIKKFGNDLIKPAITGLEITTVTFSVLLKDPKSPATELYKSNFVRYDDKTEQARLLLYTLENALRFFVGAKLHEKNGILEESIKKDWESSKRKEAFPPRQPLDCHIIFYSSFDQIKKIIVQNENWEKIFRTYFGRPNGVISRLNELDDIRDTLAHNRVISEFDFNSFKALYDQIMGCIERSS